MSEIDVRKVNQYVNTLTEQIVRLEGALAELIDNIPGQTNDADWWPDGLRNAIEKAKALINY